MKLGLSIGYSKARMELPVALVQRAEELGYDFSLVGRGVWLGRRESAGVPGRGHQTDSSRDRDHAVGGPHAGQRGDVRGHC